ncbi:hypothetical protein M885DRAFT_448295 [Pelagophyceae sp. CCMP2097]|nr:hypothetical protein M885DRAFT_448295 [Pelagophyceae sp. CCMP2097]
MPNRLFFANIEYDVTEAHLQPFFAAVGTVAHCKVVRDSFTGGSKGWGFVTYTESVYATNALSMLHQKLFRGRPIRLGEATSLALKRKELKATTAFEKREAKRQAAKAILEGAEEDAANEAADAAAEEAAEENPEASS